MSKPVWQRPTLTIEEMDQTENLREAVVSAPRRRWWSIVPIVWAAVSVHVGVVIVVLASGLLVYQWTGGRTLWLDEEMIAANIRDRGFADLTGALWLGQTAPLGWLLLQRAILVVFGTSEVALRFVPVLFGIATLVTAVWIGRRWMTPIGAAALAILFGCGYWFLFHVLELKQYSSDGFWALLIPALAAAAVEPDDATTQERRRRMTVWWTVAAIGQFFALGAVLVTPACALTLLAIVYRRDGWRAAVHAALPGVGWLAAFGLHYHLSLRAAAESDYLYEYWAYFIPPASAGVWETVSWLASRLGPFAGKPGGADGWTVFWLAAVIGVAIGWKHSRLALFFGLVPLSGLIWSGLRFLPFGDRVSLWIVPALYVAIALGVDSAARFFTRAGRRRLLPGVAAVAAGAIGITATFDVAGGRGLLTQGRLTFNHALDDRSAVAWLMAQRQPGDAMISTHHGLPAIWWYGSIPIGVAKFHPDGGPVFELSNVSAPCDQGDIATMLSGQRRALVYLGWIDDRFRGLDDLFLLRLREIGTIVASRDFVWGRALVVDLQPSARADQDEAPDPPSEFGPSLDASKVDGCLRLRPGRRW